MSFPEVGTARVALTGAVLLAVTLALLPPFWLVVRRVFPGRNVFFARWGFVDVAKVLLGSKFNSPELVPKSEFVCAPSWVAPSESTAVREAKGESTSIKPSEKRMAFGVALNELSTVNSRDSFARAILFLAFANCKRPCMAVTG